MSLSEPGHLPEMAAYFFNPYNATSSSAVKGIKDYPQLLFFPRNVEIHVNTSKEQSRHELCNVDFGDTFLISQIIAVQFRCIHSKTEFFLPAM